MYCVQHVHVLVQCHDFYVDVQPVMYTIVNIYMSEDI